MSTPGVTAMRRVAAYRTSDDKLHDTRPAAIRHQAELDLIEWIYENSNDPNISREDARDLVIKMTDEAEPIIDLLRKATTPDKKGT